MALFLISSESWQSFCQAVQQTFPIKRKTIARKKICFSKSRQKAEKKLCLKDLDGLIDEVLALDSANSYLRK